MHTNGGYARSIGVIVYNSHKELQWETRHYIKFLDGTNCASCIN